MGITATGLSSGLDVNSIVAQLVQADIQPKQQRFDRSEAIYQAQLSGYSTVKGALAAFQSAALKASSASEYLGKSATSSASDEVAVTVENDAVVGDYRLEVTQLAEEMSLASGVFASRTSEIGTGTLTITLGTTTFNSESDSYSFVADGEATPTSVSITSNNNSLAGIRDAINAAGAGTIASIINDGSGYRLVLRSESTGAANSIAISVADTSDSSNTDAAGLSRLSFDSNSRNLTQTNSAQDALLTINGLSISSATNTLSTAVEGVSLNLKGKTTSAVNISVGRDTVKAKAAVVGLVDGYNQLVDSLAPLTSYNASTGTGGLLTGDSTLRTIVTSLKSKLNASIQGVSVNYATFAELGITTNVKTGKLSIDSVKLDKVIKEDVPGLARAVASYGEVNGANLEFVSAGVGTKQGTYKVASTTASTAGIYTASSAITDFTYQGGNNATFSVAVDGGSVQNVTLSSNFSNSTENVRQEIQNQLTGVTVTVDSENKLVFTSNTTGASSSVVVSNLNADATGLGITSTAGVVGTSTISYTINGQEATLKDGLLTGKVGSQVDGLVLKLLEGASGDIGTVEVTKGLASPISELISAILLEDGLLDARTDGLQTTVNDINAQRQKLVSRSSNLEQRYFDQFNNLEQIIAGMNTTQTFLTQALSQFVDPLSFKK